MVNFLWRACKLNNEKMEIVYINSGGNEWDDHIETQVMPTVLDEAVEYRTLEKKRC
jgi:hypothetical protein